MKRAMLARALETAASDLRDEGLLRTLRTRLTKFAASETGGLRRELESIALDCSYNGELHRVETRLRKLADSLRSGGR